MDLNYNPNLIFEFLIFFLAHLLLSVYLSITPIHPSNDALSFQTLLLLVSHLSFPFYLCYLFK